MLIAAVSLLPSCQDVLGNLTGRRNADDASGEVNGAGTVTGVGTASACTSGWVGLQRFTHAEYDATLSDLFGMPVKASSKLPPASAGIYDNDFHVTAPFPTEEIESVFDISNSVITDALANPAIAKTIVPCDAGAVGPAACARTVLTRMGELAYRRPLESVELDSLVTMAQTITPFQDGIALALRSLISSPSFLYRVIRNEAPDDATATHALTPHEVASRLSYFLWGTMPDADLFAAANSGKLDVKVQLKRMMASSRALELHKNVLASWYGLDRLAEHAVDKEKYPEFDDSLRADMTTETKMLIQDVVKSGQNPMTLFSVNYTFLNARMAKHYGIDGVTGSEFRKVTLPGDKRRGITTHASLLTANSQPGMPSIVHRGVWLADKVLCTKFEPVTGAIPPEPAADGSAQTRRQAAIAQRSTGTCGSCHAKIDPFGFSLDNYDALGRYQAKENGLPIDPSGKFLTGEAFANAIEMINVLQEHKETAECVTNHYLSYAVGRKIQDLDSCALKAVAESTLLQKKSMEEFLGDIVTSGAFLKQSANPAKQASL
jgi:hypothetical protein